MMSSGKAPSRVEASQAGGESCDDVMERGPWSREDTLGGASRLAPAVRPARWLCLRDDVTGGGIFSVGEGFPADDDVKRGLWGPERMS